jgi:hypothetical protein
MKRLMGMGLMGAMVLTMLWINAQAQTVKTAKSTTTKSPSHMANSNNSVWTYRHDPADKLANADKNSRSGSLCTILSLSDAAGDGTVKGKLTFYRNFDYTAKKYAEKHEYDLPPLAVMNAGKASRVHEHVTWTATPLTSGDSAIDVHVSLMKGKDNNGNGDPHRRLVVRFKYPPTLKGRGTYDDCCDQDPDDDVLQEETPPPPDPPAP